CRVNFDTAGLSFYGYPIQEAAGNDAPHLGLDEFGNNYWLMIWLGETLKAACEVDAVTNYCVVHLPVGTYVSYSYFPVVNSKACFERWLAGRLVRLVEGIECVDHVERCPERVERVVLALYRCAEERHYCVTDVLVDDSLMPVDDIDHLREIPVEGCNEFVGPHCFGNCCKAPDVGKENCQVAVFAHEHAFWVLEE